MDQLKKLREKKGMHKMRPMEQKAKMGVVEELRNMADSAMGNKLKGLNKAQMMAEGGEVHPLEDIPVAFDDTHPDHENFLASEREDDGEDGFSAYPDADGDHLLEMDEEAKHAQDEANEHDVMMAYGGVVGAENKRKPMQSEYNSTMPNYNDMDRGEMSAHLHQLVTAMKRQGIA